MIGEFKVEEGLFVPIYRHKHLFDAVNLTLNEVDRFDLTDLTSFELSHQPRDAESNSNFS